MVTKKRFIDSQMKSLLEDEPNMSIRNQKMFKEGLEEQWEEQKHELRGEKW